MVVRTPVRHISEIVVNVHVVFGSLSIDCLSVYDTVSISLSLSFLINHVISLPFDSCFS